MELDREQKRLLMLHEYKLGTKAEKINQVWGEGTVGESAVYEHFREFKAGNEDLADKPRSGRPREVNRQAVINRIEFVLVKHQQTFLFLGQFHFAASTEKLYINRRARSRAFRWCENRI